MSSIEKFHDEPRVLLPAVGPEGLVSKPHEVYELSSSDRKLLVGNYSDTDLSADEIQQLADVLGAIASFTGGKIFDRVSGVYLMPASGFDNPAKGGDFGPYTQRLRLNIDALRNPIDDTFKPFIAKRIPNREVSMLQYMFAHEVGHAMDLNYIEEIDAHGIDKDREVPGWTGLGDKSHVFNAFEHPDPSVYLLEPSLSQRARLDASEDFAESFAIASLGGDVSKIPNKFRRLAETIKHAKGKSSIGPHKVELDKIV